MPPRPHRTSRVPRLLVVSTLAAATLLPAGAHAIAKVDASGHAEPAAVESLGTTPVLAWLGLSWL